MDEQIKYKIRDIFERQKGFAKTRDLINDGISHYYIRKFEEDGEMIRVKQGLFRHSSFEVNQFDEMVEITKVVPKGVICLLSALAYYTYNPREYQVVIYRGAKKPSLPDFSPLKLCISPRYSISMG